MRTLGGVNAINVAPRAGGGGVAPTIRLGVPTRISRRPVPYFISVLGDEGGFVHKRIFRGIKGAVGGLLSGGPLGIISGAARGFLSGDPPAEVVGTTGCPPGFIFDGRQCVPRARGRQIIGGVPGLIADVAAQRFGVEPTAIPVTTLGPDFSQSEMVTGQFGTGLEPLVRDTMTRICPRGSVLGKDGLCYNKRDIPNSQREWPRGRRPLLTGGEMRCISVAASAAKKLQRKQKQLMALGLLKRPAQRVRARLAPGHHAHVAHDGGSEH